ncbi:MAG: T9SS type A sorting domain-containing protein [Chitinophagales bacterium]
MKKNIYKVLPIWVMLFLFLEGKSQIRFLNPSFEDSSNSNSVCFSSFVDNWTVCGSEVGIIDSTRSASCYANQNFPSKGYFSNRYLIMDRSKSLSDSGVVGQRIYCPLDSKKNYQFTVLSSAFYNSPTGLISGRFSVWLGRKECQKDQQIFLSDSLELGWHQVTISFSPDSNYEYILFMPELLRADFADALLDSFSPIICLNAHQLHVRDTVLYRHGSQTPCVNLTATTTLSQYDSVRWYKIENGARKFLANGFTTSVCPDSSTTYVISMRDSATCAGVEWSWDTVRVWVKDTVLGIGESYQLKGERLVLYPDPATAFITIQPAFEEPYDYSVIDELGRVCLSGSGRKEKQLDISFLARGAYLMKVEGNVRRFVKD